MGILIEQSNILKGLAIFLVVFCHIVGCFGIRYATPLGGIGVSIFLLLSGYGLNESCKKNGLSKFFKKRLIKVYIPYLIICLADFILANFNFEKLFKNIFLITTPNFMWFIKFLILNYLVFYFINKFFINLKLKKLIWITYGFLIFFFGSALMAEQSFIFFIGILISENKFVLDKTNNWVGIFIGMIGIGALVIKQLSFIREANIYIYYFVETIIKNFGAIALIFLVVNRFYIIEKLKGIFRILGDFSYEIYLVHAILFFVLKENTNMVSLGMFLLTTVIGSIFLKYILNLKLRSVYRCKN